MIKMEEGQLSLTIEPKHDDEVGNACKSLKKVANVLRKLHKSINVAISEHEKGNTEYQIDINNFHGEYRLLADRIVKLSSFGLEDQLTKLPNRRSFDNRLKIEWSRAMRDKLSISILMLDLDNFKIYNDTHGHQQGDVALQVVGKALASSIKRGFDFAARWGGEEFVLLLPSTGLSGAMQVAETIHATVENTDIPCLAGGYTERITVSIGVYTLIPSSEDVMEDLISRADQALYQAKETGRNKVCQYDPRNLQ